MADRHATSSDTSAVSIKRDSILGSGAYGVVYLAHWKELTCAAKVIHSSLFLFQVPGKPNVAKQFEEECSIISKFRHPNIVQFLGMTHDPDTMFPVLLMELMERSLTVLLEESVEPLPYSKQIDICHDIALAITYLHSAGFIHRDISSNNVLMKGDTAKLADLGVAVLVNSGAPSRLTTCPGSEVYMPPDSVKEKPNYTEKIDCFSFGVLGIQILTRIFPKPSPRHCSVTLPLTACSTPMELVKVVPEIERRQAHLDLISCTHPLLDLFQKCLRDNGSDRPTAVQICRYVARLKEIDAYEEDQRIRSRSSSLSNVTTASAPKVARQFESSVDSVQPKTEQLLNQIEQQREMISRLERENRALLPAPSTQVRVWCISIVSTHSSYAMLLVIGTCKGFFLVVPWWPQARFNARPTASTYP
jgi:serine/threonine protein kinase